MDVRGLRVLVDLADLGTLRAVATSTGYSTSAVSQQLARLQAEVGHALVEPVGRRLALTPEGRAFLPHARDALAALEAARGELAIDGPVSGVVRVAGFATSIERHVVPAVERLATEHPALTVELQEREPDEVRSLLSEDAVDLGIVYDHSLVPDPALGAAYAESPVLLAVHRSERRRADEVIADPTTAWIANSRSADDTHLVHHVCAEFGVAPRIDHHIDAIPLVTHLVASGLGAALLAADAPRHPGVRYLDLAGRGGARRSYTVTRPGRESWRSTRALIAAIEQVAARERALEVHGRGGVPDRPATGAG